MQVYTFIHKDTKIEILGRTQHTLVVIHKYCKLGDMKARKQHYVLRAFCGRLLAHVRSLWTRSHLYNCSEENSSTYHSAN